MKLSYSNNISKNGSEARRIKCLFNYNNSIKRNKTKLTQ